MNRPSWFYYGVFFLALGATRCSVFEPPDATQRNDAPTALDGTGRTGGETGETTSGSDEQWWIVTNEHGCTSVRTPTKDDRPDAAYEGESIAPIYLAMSRVNLGASNDDEASTPNPEAWKEFGFDRDGLCTGSPTCCVDPTKCEEEEDRISEPSCSNLGGIAGEGKYCIDNVMGSLFSIGFSIPNTPFALLGMSPADWNCELRRGGFSMIFKISNYNGSKYDPYVRVDMYVSTGLQNLKDRWKCRDDYQSPLRENWYENPRWRPSLHWKIAKRSVSLSSQPTDNEVPDSTTFDSTAFVRSGYLFAALPDGQEFTFAGDNVLTTGYRNIMYNPVLLAKLIYNPSEKTWRMEDVELAFYVLSSDFLRAFREAGFCDNACGMAEQLKAFADASKDVLLSGESLPDVACDALSLSTKFQAHQVTATKEDIEEIEEPKECPPLKNPAMPPYGCVCQKDGTCVLEDSGIPEGSVPADSGIPEGSVPADSGIRNDAGRDTGI